MNLRFKLILLFFLLSLGAVFFLQRAVHSHFVVREKQEFAARLTERVSVLSQLVDEQLLAWQKEMLDAGQKREIGKAVFASESRWQWLLRLKKNDKGQWQADWAENNSSQPTASVADMTNAVYESLPADKISQGKVTLFPLKTDPRLLAMTIPVAMRYLEDTETEEALYVGIFPVDRLLKSGALFKSFDGRQRLIDDGGHVILAEDAGLIGRRATEDFLVEIVLKKREPQGTVELTADSGEPQLAYYRLLDGANLYVISSGPADFQVFYRRWLAAAAIILLAVNLAAAVLIWFFTGGVVLALNRLGQILSALAQGHLQTPIPDDGPVFLVRILTHLKMLQNRLLDVAESEKAPAVTPPPPPAEDIADAQSRLVHELVEDIAPPLTAILGSAQKGRQLTRSPEVLSHLNAIVQEAEDLRRYVDGLVDEAVVEEEPFADCRLLEVANRAISQASGELKKSGVVVRKDYHSVQAFKGQAVRLQAALVEVLLGSMEMAKQGEHKEILVGISPQGESVEISVTDWGVHDPLAETDGEEITSAALLAVSSTVKAHRGDILLDYSRDGQRTVQLAFPLKDGEILHKERVILSSGGSASLSRRQIRDVDLPEAPLEFEDTGVKQLTDISEGETIVRKTGAGE